MTQSLGSHLIFDVENTDFDLNDFELIKTNFEELMHKHKFSIVGEMHKQFEPQGVTSIWLLEESHLSIHTWPESKKCTIDLQHCLAGARDVLESFAEGLKALFGAQNVVTNFQLDRGLPTRALNHEQDNGFFALFPDYKLLHHAASTQQQVEVIEHPWLGRGLILDNIVQFCEKFNDVYSPALTDRVLENAINNRNVVTRTLFNLNLICSKPRMRFLIIGGGDGRITYQMKNSEWDRQIASVTTVEIDKLVSDVCREQFPASVLLDDSKQEQLQMDAIEQVRQNKEAMKGEFDGVIIDSTDPSVGISAGLFTKEFQENIQQMMKPGAMLSQQCDTNQKWLNTLMPVFQMTSLKFMEVKKVHTVEYTGETQILYFKN